MVGSSIVICWMSPFVILGVSGVFCHFYSIFDGKSCLLNNVYPDQMPHYVASDLGLHCLFMTLLPVKHILLLINSNTSICVGQQNLNILDMALSIILILSYSSFSRLPA